MTNVRSIYWIVRPIIIGVMLFYFGFHMMYGDQGLIGRTIEAHKQTKLHAEIDQVVKQRRQLEHRLSLITGKAIDADLLDELARRQLPMAGEKELIIID